MAALSEEFLKEIRKHVRYDCIFNITHINNLVSIFENGLLSYNRAKKLTHEDIAETGIQERRKYIQVPNGLMLHDYASCYINARNAMLF